MGNIIKITIEEREKFNKNHPTQKKIMDLCIFVIFATFIPIALMILIDTFGIIEFDAKHDFGLMMLCFFEFLLLEMHDYYKVMVVNKDDKENLEMNGLWG